jgi:hypothetical protein
MDRITQGVDMTDGRRMLLETLAGHFALLKSAHPRKANTATAQKAHRYIAKSLRESSRKRAA